MPHKRSRDAHIRRTAARIVSTHSHRDYEKAEAINVLTPGQVLFHLIEKLPRQRINDLLKHKDMFTKGEILSDARGRGSQQAVPTE